MLTRKPCLRFVFPGKPALSVLEELTIMSDKVLYNGAMIFSLLALLLVVTNVCLIKSNRNLEVELSQRQAAINNSGAQGQLNSALVQALAQASVNNDDKEARDLLSSQGISVKSKAAAAAAAPAEKKK